MDESTKQGVCKCPHHKVIPGLLVLFGLAFLLGNMGVISANVVNIAWPILVIVGGLSKWSEDRCQCC